MATQEGNLIEQFVKSIQSNPVAKGVGQFVQQVPQLMTQATQTPGQFAQQVAPKAPITPLLQGNVPGSINQAKQNLSDQEKIMENASAARNKQLNRIPLTSQDKAAIEADNQQAMSMVFAGSTGDLGEVAPELGAASSGGGGVAKNTSYIYDPPTNLPPITNTSNDINGFTAKNTWSPFIKAEGEQGAGVIPNPNYKPGSTGPTQYAQDTSNADAIAAEPGANPAPAPKPTTPPATKPTIPGQPDLTPQQLKAFQKSGLDKYQLPASYGDKRATLEQIDKSVMANVVKGTSPEDVIQKLPAAEQNVWSQVEAKAADVPSVDIEQNVVPHINSRLEDLVHQGIITDAQYEQLSKETATGIYAKATDPLAADKTITGSDLIKLQTGANARVPKNIPPGSSAIAYINKAIADGYRDAIGNMDPSVRGLYNQYSSLKRIGEMSNSFRNTAGANPSLLDQFKKNPITGTLAALGAGGAVIGGVKGALPLIGEAAGVAGAGLKSAEDYIANKAGYTQKSNADQMNAGLGEPQGSNGNTQDSTHGGIVPQNGRYSMQMPQTAGFLTTNDYTNQVNAINSRLPQEKLNNPQAAASDESTLSQLNTSWTNQRPIRDAGVKVNNVMGLGNAAYNLITKADPGLFNLNGSYDKLLNSSDPKYAALGKALESISKTTGIDLSTATTKDALVAGLDQAIKVMQTGYNAQLQQYFGGNPDATSKTTLPPITNTQPAPTAQPGVNNVNFDFGGAGQGLPPIQ